MPTLFIRYLELERTVSFDSGSVTLGRSESCEITLEDPKVSRRHLTFYTLDDCLAVRDLGSRNGSMLAGERLREVAAVHDGDVVQVGDTEILVSVPREGTAKRHLLGRIGEADETFQEDEDEPHPVPRPPRETARVEPPPARPRSADAELFLEINRRLAAAEDLDGLLEEIVASALSLTGAQRGFLLRREADRLSFAVTRTNLGEPVPSPSREISRSVVGDAIRLGDAVMSGNATGDVRFEDAVSVVDLSLRSVLCVPLWRGRKVAGVLYVDSETFNAFSPDHRKQLGHFADQASIALTNAMLAADLLAKSEALERSNAEVQRLCRDLQEKVEIQTQELETVREQLAQTRAQDKLRYSYDEIVGASPSMRGVLKILDRVTDSDVPVLIEGESGTGKELIARALHYNSPRALRPLQAINCAAVSESLLESELFGVEKGAFTGADRDRKGLIELADGGTLFLDEVGEMSLGMQAKLLRVLEEGEVRPVGGKKTVHVDLRLVAATNRRLAEMVTSGSFRGDLYYRIRGVSVTLPPLRERREDIPLLLEHFSRMHDPDPAHRKSFSRSLIDRLVAHDWPGNIRELEQEVRRLLALGGETIGCEHLSPQIAGAAVGGRGGRGSAIPSGSLRDAVDALERQMLGAALERHQGNKSRVAAELGLSRPGLQKKMKRLGLE